MAVQARGTPGIWWSITNMSWMLRVPSGREAIPTNVPTAIIVAPYSRATLGEGPHWDPTTQNLYWIDIVGKKVFVHRTTGQTLPIDLPHMPGCLAPCGDNSLLLSLQDGLVVLDLATQKITPWKARNTMEKDRPLNRFNDGKVDPQGRYYRQISSLKF